jgi:hypothetical protein
MEPSKREVRFYLDETEYPFTDYVAEWVEWHVDHKVITRTLRSFISKGTDPMAARQQIIAMNGDDTPVWFMGALRHLSDHRAAPELLAALKELVDYDEGCSEAGDYGYEVLHRCKAAINKAEGRVE